jgi:protein CpxP
MKTTMKSAVTTLAALLLVFASNAFAQDPDFDRPERRGRNLHPRAERGDMLKKALGRLDLTDEQKESIKAMFESHREKMQPGREALHDARKALREEMQSDSFDEAAIRQLSVKVHATETDMAVDRAAFRHQVLQLLTEEQRAELKEMQARRKERMKERRDGNRRRPPREDR